MSGQFVIVPARALDDKELRKSPAAYMVLCTLSTYANRDGFCFVKRSTLATRASCSERAIAQHTAKLKKLGYIEIIPRFKNGQQISNGYRIDHNGLLPTERDYKGDEAELHGGDEAELHGGDEAELHTERLSLTGKKKKRALTRQEFLREVDRGLKDGEFDKFEHLTETELFCAAEECLDFYGAKGEWPAGEPAIVLRHWIRGGIKKGNIRKPAKKEAMPADLPDWQKEALEKEIFTPDEFTAWIAPLEYNGNGAVYAQSEFKKQYLEQHYLHHLQTALHHQIKIKVKEQHA